MDKLKCPCVNWYPESFMAGTRKMTDEEVGIYIRALNNQFIEGGIEADEYKSFPAKVKTSGFGPFSFISSNRASNALRTCSRVGSF